MVAADSPGQSDKALMNQSGSPDTSLAKPQMFAAEGKAWISRRFHELIAIAADQLVSGFIGLERLVPTTSPSRPGQAAIETHAA
jgi:hypothetical protein